MLFNRPTLVIIIVCLFFTLCHCSKAENDNRLHLDLDKNFYELVTDNNIIDGDSRFIDFLVKNKININELSDILYNSNNDSLLLLFRNGFIVEYHDNENYDVIIQSSGSGPGEMRFAETFKIKDSKLYVLDFNLNKIIIFDLEGNHEKDIIIPKGVGRSFEIIDGDKILIINYSKFENGLFFVIDNEGNINERLGVNNVIHPIQNIVEGIPTFKINKNPHKDEIILSSEGTGESFIFDLNDNRITGEFSIQFGPEWERIVEAEKQAHQEGLNGYFNKIQDVDFLPNSDIFVSWGGPFDGRNTVGMIFDSNGFFKKRILGNEIVKNMPDFLSIKNDSTFFIYSWADDYLGEVQLKHNE